MFLGSQCNKPGYVKPIVNIALTSTRASCRGWNTTDMSSVLSTSTHLGSVAQGAWSLLPGSCNHWCVGVQPTTGAHALCRHALGASILVCSMRISA